MNKQSENTSLSVVSGLAEPNAIVEAVACLQGCQQLGMPECDVLLVQCAVRLARAPKSTEVYRAMRQCQKHLAQAKGPLPPVPLHLRNAPTKLMKQLGINTLNLYFCPYNIYISNSMHCNYIRRDLYTYSLYFFLYQDDL